MTATPYLRVRSWEKYQHYKDRRPPWIKYHVELLDDYSLTHLPYATQLLFDRLLLLAARTDNNIPRDHLWIASQTHIEPASVEIGIETLVAMRFLSVADTKRSASKALARRKRSDEPETEAVTETDKGARKRANGKPKNLAFERIKKAIENRALATEIDLEAELKANPALSDAERVALRALIAA